MKRNRIKYIHKKQEVSVTDTPGDLAKNRNKIKTRISCEHSEHKPNSGPEHNISYNTIKIRIRITMDNEPKHLSSFFICNDLHKVLFIVYTLHGTLTLERWPYTTSRVTAAQIL